MAKMNSGLTIQALRALLVRASGELSDSDRASLTEELRAILAYYDELLVEQPDPGAVAVICDIFGPDILSAKAALAKLRLPVQEPPHAKAIRIALAIVLGIGPKYEIAYLEIALREIDLLRQNVQEIIIVHGDISIVSLHNLAANDRFTWLNIADVAYSNAVILEISPNGVLDLVLCKRGSARRYPMKLGAADFVAGFTEATQYRVGR